MGRTNPMGAPSARSSRTAARTYRAGVPKATTTTSAPSVPSHSASGSTPATMVAVRAAAAR